VCEPINKFKGKEIPMGSYRSFGESMFSHQQEVQRKNQELGARETMEGELWSMLEILWNVIREK